jgi:hypothetical protein
MNHPKGKLIAIGGAEDKGTNLKREIYIAIILIFFELGILRRVMEEAGGSSSRIELSQQHHDTIRSRRELPKRIWKDRLHQCGCKCISATGRIP